MGMVCAGPFCSADTLALVKQLATLHCVVLPNSKMEARAEPVPLPNAPQSDQPPAEAVPGAPDSYEAAMARLAELKSKPQDTLTDAEKKEKLCATTTCRRQALLHWRHSCAPDLQGLHALRIPVMHLHACMTRLAVFRPCLYSPLPQRGTATRAHHAHDFSPLQAACKSGKRAQDAAQAGHTAGGRASGDGPHARRGAERVARAARHV